MRFLRFGLIALLALLLTVFGIAYFKSSTWSAEGVLTIEAPPEKVLPFVASPKYWLDWNPWSDPTDPEFEASFSGPDSGPGSKLSWKTKDKHGELTIVSVGAAEVAYEMSLDGAPGTGEIKLEPYGTQTRVRWHYTGDLGGNLFGRFFIGLMQKMLVPTLQKGLGNLRTRVAKG